MRGGFAGVKRLLLLSTFHPWFGNALYGARVDKFAHLIALNTSEGPGVVAMWLFLVYESNMGLTYLEGCQRAWLDGALVPIGDGEDYRLVES